MRVIVAGWISYAGDETTCAEIIRGGAAHIVASRAEPGCVAYIWAVDPLEPGRIQVYEEWESERDLLAHFRDPSYAAMRDHLGQWQLTGFGVQLYGTTTIEPVYDAAGVARTTIFGVTLD